MEHKSDKKPKDFVSSHGILLILSLNFTKFVLFLLTLIDLAIFCDLFHKMLGMWALSRERKLRNSH